MEVANQMIPDHQVQIHNMDAGRSTTVLPPRPSQVSEIGPSTVAAVPLGRAKMGSGDWQRGPAHSTVISDEVRAALIDGVYIRPGIWDSQREKNGPGRKQLFQEITHQLNEQHHQGLSCEEVEKQWKNLKDTYNKTKKKMGFDSDGRPITPKWKFFVNMMFLDQANMPIEQGGPGNLTYIRARSEETLGRKRLRDDDVELTEDDQYYDFCRSLVHNLRKIGEMDRIKYLSLTKNIRDLVYDTEMDLLRQSEELLQQQQHSMQLR
ncbi:unnamed protein product, partial [Mesorhabditis spiculigera]